MSPLPYFRTAFWARIWALIRSMALIPTGNLLVVKQKIRTPKNVKRENKKETMEGENPPQGGSCGDRPTFHFTIAKKGDDSTNFYVTLIFKSPTSGRNLKKVFAILIPKNTKNKAFWTKNVIAGAVLRYFEEVPRIKIMNMKSKRELGNGVYRILKKVTNRTRATEILANFEQDGKEYLSGPEPKRQIPFAGNYGKQLQEVNPPPPGGEEGGGGEEEAADSPLTTATRSAIASIALPAPTTSVFKPEETGVTYAMVGKSMSGKTTFLVNNLNLLTEQELNQYNAIVYFTKSPNANPLADLKPETRKRFIMVGRFCPRILMAMKRLNDETDLMFKFLVIFDDILRLRGALLSECILTLRNSNISTALSIQYEKLMSPAQRASVHNVFIFNLRTEQWEFFLKGFIVGNIKEIVPPLRTVKRVWEVAQTMREVMNPFILYYDQRNDKTMFFHKKKK